MSAAFSTFAFIYLAVYAYVISYPAFGQGEVGLEQLENLVSFVGGWGARFFFLMVSVLASSWVARAAGGAAILHGILTGILAAIISQIIVHFLYPPVELFELSVYLIFGTVGGFLGGHDARRALTSEEALYRASRQISTAQKPDDIVAAIGEHAGGSEVESVVLWCLAPELTDDSEPKPWAFWISSRAGKNQRQSLRNGTFETPVVEDLTAAGRSGWNLKAARSALVVPLTAPGEVRVGLLEVEFRKRHRLSRRVIRGYLNIGAQAALVLKNLQLAEQAQRAGEQAGVLLERQRLSHEIHDTLAQGFTSVLMSLTAMELSQPPFQAHEPSHRHLEEARQTARENLAEARRLIWALHPEPLERHSLPEVLEILVEEWSEQTDIETAVTVTGSPVSLRPETEISLFRIAQESLANARKHAGASRVSLTLSYKEDRVVLNILDNGVGFGTVETDGWGRPGFGLIAMRERAEQLGGSFSVESTPGEGTTTVAELPACTEAGSDTVGKVRQEENS